MMSIFSALLGFLQALPDLIKIYNSIKKLFGDDLSKVADDLQKQAALIDQSNAPGITIEQRRDLRREALTAGYGMWTRISD